METEKAKSVIESAAAFKSYYVVWKLPNILKREVMTFLFKSYYVVWKPKKKLKGLQKIGRLNRTM